MWQKDFLRFDDERWGRTIATIKDISENQGKEAAGRHWIRYAQNGEDDNGDAVFSFVPRVRSPPSPPAQSTLARAVPYCLCEFFSHWSGQKCGDGP